MIERVVENWLADATERSFQVPFCHVLTSKGYTVLHMSRHCGMELGKDIIALDPDGTPCAFQLKTPQGQRLTLREWRGGINQQVHDLVTLKLIHPSLPSHRHHRSFLVMNRGIDEEVTRAIDDMNRHWEDSDRPELKLETVVGGEIYQDAVALGTNLWPTELSQVRTLLELFLQDGAEHLPKPKLAALLEETMGLSEDAGKPSKAHAVRSCSSAAVLCAMATRNFAEQRNHFAQIEAWVMYLAHVLAVAERRSLAQMDWKPSVDVAVAAIENALVNLIEELRTRKHLVEGDPTTDAEVRRVRITCLVALVSIYALWMPQDDDSEDGTDTFAREFCEQYRSQLLMWGEAVVPQFLAFYWYWRKVDATPHIDFLLSDLIELVCRANAPNANPAEAVATPYNSAEEVLAERLGTIDEPREVDYRKNSYSLESLIHLFVRQNWKNRMKELWPQVTRVWFNRFDPRSKWRFFLWNTDKGEHWSACPNFPKKWDALRSEAEEGNGDCIPASIKKFPLLLLIFLVVYPHRLNANIVRWLDTRMREDSSE